jgi:hypothetical protein
MLNLWATGVTILSTAKEMVYTCGSTLVHRWTLPTLAICSASLWIKHHNLSSWRCFWIEDDAYTEELIEAFRCLTFWGWFAFVLWRHHRNIRHVVEHCLISDCRAWVIPLSQEQVCVWQTLIIVNLPLSVRTFIAALVLKIGWPSVDKCCVDTCLPSR